MTEDDWLSGNDPAPMLRYVGLFQPSARKLRLFGCACCRRVWHLYNHDSSREAVLAAERYADGLAGPEELANAYANAEGWRPEDDAAQACAVGFSQGGPLSEVLPTIHPLDVNRLHFIAANTARALWSGRVSWPVRDESQPTRKAAKLALKERKACERRYQSDLMRDLFGNPFRRLALDLDWLQWHDGLLGEMARTIYDERRFADLPILADALEEAGCEVPTILEHCRQRGPHARGCWVLDLLLGKA